MEEWQSSRLKSKTLIKVTLHHVCFTHFLNCTNDTKSHKASHINFDFQTNRSRDGSKNMEFPYAKQTSVLGCQNKIVLFELIGLP